MRARPGCDTGAHALDRAWREAAATNRIYHVAEALSFTFTLVQRAAAEVGYLRETASYEPPRSDPDRTWWDDLINDG
jgi:hypothetical protein